MRLDSAQAPETVLETPSVNNITSLMPLLVEGASGRTGTTLLMAILGSSPAICFDRVFPFEIRYLTRMLEVCSHLGPVSVETNKVGPFKQLLLPLFWKVLQVGRLVRRNTTAHMIPVTNWDKDYSLRITPDPLSALPAWHVNSPILAQIAMNDPQYYRCMIVPLWRDFSRTLAEKIAMTVSQPASSYRYYAEKTDPWAGAQLRGLMDVRTIYLIRDPRDTWLSIMSLDRRRGYYGFGRVFGEARQSYLDRFLFAQRQYLKQLLDFEDNKGLVVYYEKLILDKKNEADRIASWLGCSINAADPALIPPDLLRRHMTSVRPEASIQRWRREMSSYMQRKFIDALGPYLEAHRYQLD